MTRVHSMTCRLAAACLFGSFAGATLAQTCGSPLPLPPRSQAMPPLGRDALVIVGMDNAAPAEFVIGFGRVEIVVSHAEESQGVGCDVGEPPGGVGGPAEPRHAVEDSQLAPHLLLIFRDHRATSLQHWITRTPGSSIRVSGTARTMHR